MYQKNQLGWSNRQTTHATISLYKRNAFKYCNFNATLSLTCNYILCLHESRFIHEYEFTDLIAHRSHALRFRDANEMQSINLNAHSLRICFILKRKIKIFIFIFYFSLGQPLP